MAETTLTTRLARTAMLTGLTVLLTVFPAGGLFAHPVFESRQARYFLEQGNLEAAEGALQRARFEDPDHPVVLYDLGIISYRRREYAQAVAYWEKALQVATDAELRRKTLHNLGNAAYRAQQFAMAAETYKSALEIAEDPQTRFNLEQAEKRLREEQEKQKQQDQQQQDPNQPGQEGQQKNDQGQNSQDGKKGQDQQQNGQKAQDQKGQDQKGDPQNQDGQQGDQKKPGQDEKPGSNQTGQKDQTASDTKPTTGEDNASGTQSVADADEQKRQDVSMGEQKDQKPPPPEASQKARGLKNQKMNPYLVEKVLKDLEEREKEIQLRYRNEPGRRRDLEDIDPFFMSPEELQEFIERRRSGKPKGQENQDSPDW